MRLQEVEIVASIAEAEANLSAVAAELAVDPTNEELLAARNQLQTALAATRQVLSELEYHAAKADRSAEAVVLQEEEEEKHRHERAAEQTRRKVSDASNAVLRKPTNPNVHPRSTYATSVPDFAALATEYPSLRPYLIFVSRANEQTIALDTIATDVGAHRYCTIDFSNAAACRELTRVLLKRDFDIVWDSPDGHLIPTVTNRLNYILWLQDILALANPCLATHAKKIATNDNTPHLALETMETSQVLRGIDLGCGANLIYPLLGAAVAGWHFVGVDVGKRALEWAERNRRANPRLADMIEIRAVEPTHDQAAFFERDTVSLQDLGRMPSSGGMTANADDSSRKSTAAKAQIHGSHMHHKPKRQRLAGGDGDGAGVLARAVLPGERFAFTMCNPPFFEHISHANGNPATAYGGTALEMAYPGGELAFVRSMLEDSKILKDRVYWFTTMVGKKSTLRTVRSELYKAGVSALRTTEFAQGKTARWGLAWSFQAPAATASMPLARHFHAAVTSKFSAELSATTSFLV